MARQREIVRVLAPGSDAAALATSARDGVATEVAAGDGGFVQGTGPFVDYHRRVVASADAVTETTTYRLDVPWFGWVFAPLVHRQLRSGRAGRPFWAPPGQLDPRSVRLLGLLAAASMSAAFTNTLFTQTANYAAESFGVDDLGQGIGAVVVRIGVVITLPFAILADRHGRRRMIVITAWAAPIVCALGALAPSFGTLVATQTVGRPLGLALATLIGVAAVEDMPRDSRAYALSLLAMAAGLGAGIAVGALPLADLGGEGSDGWRLVYATSLVWLVVAASLGRSLQETRRFVARHPEHPPIHRRRLVLVGTVAVVANLFIAPASFFQNRYLDEVRDMSALGITIFTFCTATPASIGLLAGGRLADVVGRRWVVGIALPLSTVSLAATFAVGGPAMWALAIVGGLLAGVAYPALQVYRAELFPTGNRGTANGILTAIALAGGSVGLIVVGALRDAGWSFAGAIAVVAGGELVAAAIVVLAYPETAHLELEQINPEDAVPVIDGADRRLA
jgi:MFS family permease